MPPPFFLDPSPEWPTIAAKLKELTDGDITAFVRGKHIRVKTSTAAHFRTVQRHLMAAKVPFHTFTVGGARSLKVVIGGLPPTMTDVDLGDALGAENFAVETTARLRTRAGRTNRWVVAFVADQENDGARRAADIFTISELFHVRVTVEVYKKPPGPPQCHHCQGFGHGSSNCGRPLRCVRCGEAHNVYRCQRPPAEKGTCCNCGGDHNANWRGCPSFQAAKTVSTNRSKSGRKNPPRRRPMPATKPATTVSTPLAEEEEESSTEEEQGETTKKKRRKRQPRNPANRRLRGEPATANPPDEVIAAQQQPAQEASRPSAKLPARLPKPATKRPAPSAETSADLVQQQLQAIFAALAEITSQLSTLSGLIADLAKSQ